jgi:flagellar motor switch protein FliG
MRKPQTVDRIRQVAVVLASVDAATARKLLSQLPEAQARLVRQRIANLGAVSPAERESAMESFMRLNRSMSNPSPSASAMQESSVASPAEALLSAAPESIDRFEATASFSDTPANRPSMDLNSPSGFVPVQPQSLQPFSPAWSPTWQQWSGEDLARMLLNERPNVIAALLLQSPTELGSAILQALPAHSASAVLAALPQLHTTDPFILEEIYDQLNHKLIDFQQQTGPNNAGMTKLHALLDRLPTEQQSRIRRSLSKQDPMLAHTLGIRIEEDIENDSTENSHDSLPTSQDENNEPQDLVDMVVPFVTKPAAHSNAIDEFGSLDFEELRQFTSEDLALVLRSLDPQTILLAFSAAGPEMRARVEALLDSRHIDRLRKRLHSLRRVSAAEKSAAQQKIARVAGELLRQGRIARLDGVSFIAA